MKGYLAGSIVFRLNPDFYGSDKKHRGSSEDRVQFLQAAYGQVVFRIMVLKKRVGLLVIGGHEKLNTKV